LIFANSAILFLLKAVLTHLQCARARACVCVCVCVHACVRALVCEHACAWEAWRKRVWVSPDQNKFLVLVTLVNKVCICILLFIFHCKLWVLLVHLNLNIMFWETSTLSGSLKFDCMGWNLPEFSLLPILSLLPSLPTLSPLPIPPCVRLRRHSLCSLQQTIHALCHKMHT
jgi:hypothetical protein